MGSIVPASGAGGLALGAWILHEGGMPAERIARRSVAFFLIKSSVNFVAVVVIGTLMAVGVFGPHKSLLADAASGGGRGARDRPRAADPATARRRGTRAREPAACSRFVAHARKALIDGTAGGRADAALGKRGR